MSNKQTNFIWGLVLILAGGLLLLNSLGIIPDFSQLVWAILSGLASLFFIAVYVFSKERHWSWLIPIFATGGAAISAALGETTINPIWIGAFFMAFLSIPFWYIFLYDRKENWWALIPGYTFAVLTLIVLMSEVWAGETIGALVMWAIALPFFYVFFRNREYWWALIPAFVMAGMGFVVLLSAGSAEEIIGTIVLLVIALPFFAVFFFVKGQWWAIIPAGIMTTLAVMVPFAVGIEGETFEARLVAVFMFLGFAVPFSYLWLRRKVYPTSWAKYPAVGLIVAAVVTLALGTVVENSWPIILIVIGAWLLIDNFRQPKLKS